MRILKEAGEIRHSLQRYACNGDIRRDFMQAVCHVLTNGWAFHSRPSGMPLLSGLMWLRPVTAQAE